MSARRREPERLEEFVFESTTMVLAAGLEMTKHSVTSAPGEFVREKGPLGIGSTWRCQVFEELVGRINTKEMGALALGAGLDPKALPNRVPCTVTYSNAGGFPSCTVRIVTGEDATA